MTDDRPALDAVVSRAQQSQNDPSGFLPTDGAWRIALAQTTPIRG